MYVVFGVIIGILILMLLVVAHEFGHFIMARKNGVTVKEFGVGFPPRMIAWVKKPVEVNKDGKKITQSKWTKIPKSDWDKPQKSLILSLNFLPIGGFCSMDGESDADTRKGTLGAATFWQKTKILFGGVLMNWLVAAILLTVLAFTGMPQFLKGQFYLKNDAVVSGSGVTVAKVMEGSPAERAGFRYGDQIISVGDVEVMTPNDVTDYNALHRGERVIYRVRSNAQEGDMQCTVADCKMEDGTYYEHELEAELNPVDAEYSLGIQMSFGQTFVRSTWSAPIVGVGTTLQLTSETFKSLGQLVWNLVSGAVSQFSFDSSVRESGQVAIGSAGDSVSGPVGIIGVIFPAFASSGLRNLAFLTALISVSLACMNVLPIPALDGGRWLMIAIARLRGKKLKKETEEKIVSTAFMIIIGLAIIISILDIIRLF